CVSAAGFRPSQSANAWMMAALALPSSGAAETETFSLALGQPGEAAAARTGPIFGHRAPGWAFTARTSPAAVSIQKSSPLLTGAPSQLCRSSVAGKHSEEGCA